MKKYEIEIGNKKIEFQIRNWAARTNGEVIVRCGDTQVLATCAMSYEDVEELGYFPLSVYYEEKYYAAGKILGPRYIKREGKPSDNAVVISRLIDRTIRPLFDEDLKREVQVIVTCLSWDEENDPDILGILGASLCLLISDIPWQGPVGAVRIGLKDKRFILNPTYDRREDALLDIILAGVQRDGQVLINMIEATAEEMKEELIAKAAKKALVVMKKVIELQQKIAADIGQEKAVIEKRVDTALENKMKEFVGQKIEEILFNHQGKKSIEQGMEQSQELNELKRGLIGLVEEEHLGKGYLAKEFFEQQAKEVVQEKILTQEERVDGRKLDEIREMGAEVDLVPRAHGSSFFARGLTRSLSILTLGGPGEQQLIESMEIMTKKRFLHHYNFPPYSTGEVKRLQAPSRREIGHGMLVEKALFPIIPEFDDFPYTIRIVSEIVCSNGSTSMAAVCSSTLALMDAGVPIKKPVAGISVGIVQDKITKNYKLLTDIQGPEDFYGGMDFKIAGTKKGITAIQMDVKIPGIDEKILKEVLIIGRKARFKILEVMKQALAKPRPTLSRWAPRIYKLKIPTEKIGEIIGPRGQTIKRISEQTNASIDIQDEGIVYVTALKENDAKRAVGIIKNITREIKVGETFLGKVTRVVNFGVFLELVPGQEGLLHASYMTKPLKLGDQVPVRVASVDEHGRVNLAQKESYRGYAPKKNFEMRSRRKKETRYNTNN